MSIISGIAVAMKAIGSQMDDRVQRVEKVAGEYAKKALMQFRQHQFASTHEPDGKGVTDTAAMKAAAKAFAAAHQSGLPVTIMGDPWINRTFRAARTVYADYGVDGEKVYFSLYHTMSYGVYLELAKNRKYAVLEPIIRSLAEPFMKDVKAVFGDK